jgi:hypothetical protein
MAEVPQGNRKVILTKWMLVIFSVVTIGYFILLGLHGATPPDSFFMNFVLGLGAIGGAFTIGNIFEHRAKSAEEIEKERNSDNAVKRVEAERAKAEAEAEKAKANAQGA